MRFLRMTTRRWMVVVAVIAATLFLEEHRKRAAKSAEYRTIAEAHEGRLQTLALIRRLGQYPYAPCWLGRIPLRYDAETAPRHARHVSHHTALKLKYERAARCPWLPVEPDPPEPK